jgi:hypothetical protein
VESETGQVLELSTDDPRRAVAALRAAGFDGASLFGSHVHLHSHAPQDDLVRIRDLLGAAGLHVGDAAQRAVSMEDVFVSRVRRLEELEEAGASATAVVPSRRGRAV